MRKKTKELMRTYESLQDNPAYWKDVEGRQLLTKDQWLDDLALWFKRYNEEVKDAVWEEKKG